MSEYNLCCVAPYSVAEDQYAVVETCGCYQQIAGRVSTRIRQHISSTQTKTKDNVFVSMDIGVQYQVLTGTSDEVDKAMAPNFIHAKNPEQQGVPRFLKDIHHPSGYLHEPKKDPETGEVILIEQETDEVDENGQKKRDVDGKILMVKVPIMAKVESEMYRIALEDYTTAENSKKTREEATEHRKEEHQAKKAAVGMQGQELAVYNAYYTLTNPQAQIESFVDDAVRGCVPRVRLDELFLLKDWFAVKIKESIDIPMAQFGFKIVNCLVVDINVDSKVRSAMNEINASKRLREAAKEKAEAEKKIKVIAAEAEKEAKALSGEGLSNMRQAIVAGLKTAVADFSGNVKTTVNGVEQSTTAKEVMEIVLLTQYLDTMQAIGADPKTKTVFCPMEAN